MQLKRRCILRLSTYSTGIRKNLLTKNHLFLHALCMCCVIPSFWYKIRVCRFKLTPSQINGERRVWCAVVCVFVIKCDRNAGSLIWIQQPHLTIGHLEYSHKIIPIFRFRYEHVGWLALLWGLSVANHCYPT